MASYTPNINLKKPADGDAYDIADANGNMDAIDTAIGSLRESVNQTSGSLTALLSQVNLDNNRSILYDNSNDIHLHTPLRTNGTQAEYTFEADGKVYVRTTQNSGATWSEWRIIAQ